MWIVNERDLNWPGATVLNMEAGQQMKGKRGGIELTISPEIPFTEIYRTAIGVDLEAMKVLPLSPEHVEMLNLFHTENAIPDGELDISQKNRT